MEKFLESIGLIEGYDIIVFGKKKVKKWYCIWKGEIFMEENEKKQIIDEAHDTIDKAKEYINKLGEADLKAIKEVESLINMFKKPFWKVVLWIIIVCSVLNAFYILGDFIGAFIANLGL